MELEQYPTPPDIAAHMLFAADAEGDVEDALVADLGCGGCILGIGAALMGAMHVMAVDIDADALLVAAQNVEDAEVSVDLIKADVVKLAIHHAMDQSGHDRNVAGFSNSVEPQLSTPAETDAEPGQSLFASMAPIGLGPFDLVLMNPPFGTQKQVVCRALRHMCLCMPHDATLMQRLPQFSYCLCVM